METEGRFTNIELKVNILRYSGGYYSQGLQLR